VRSFRYPARIGHLRLHRLLLTLFTSNIRNGLDGEVVSPGGLNFHLLIDNIPYTRDNTSFAIEFDVDVDIDNATLTNNRASPYVDPDGLDVEDKTEGIFRLSQSSLIRWRRRVYCKKSDNQNYIIRVRVVSSSDPPGDGYTARKRLLFTFHNSRSLRCNSILWDPAAESVDNSDSLPTSSTGVTDVSNSGGSSLVSSNVGSSSIDTSSPGTTGASSSGSSGGSSSGSASSSGSISSVDSQPDSGFKIIFSFFLSFIVCCFFSV